MEIWAKIEGVKYYEVSNIGNIRRLDSYVIGCSKGTMVFKKGGLIKLKKNKKGYITITFSIDGVIKKDYVHRVVAKSFIQNKESKPYINHINGVKDDNRVENLEWCTQKENISHAINTLNVTYIGGGHHRKKSVLCENNGELFESATNAARSLNLNAGHVASVCRGILKNHKGYKFKYV